MNLKINLNVEIIRPTNQSTCFSPNWQYETVLLNNTKVKATIPQEHLADPEKHDILLEVIWKLKTFMHYHCFEEFSSQTYLHDLIQQSIEAVFTDDLLLRWYVDIDIDTFICIFYLRKACIKRLRVWKGSVFDVLMFFLLQDPSKPFSYDVPTYFSNKTGLKNNYIQFWLLP